MLRFIRSSRGVSYNSGVMYTCILRPFLVGSSFLPMPINVKIPVFSSSFRWVLISLLEAWTNPIDEKTHTRHPLLAPLWTSQHHTTHTSWPLVQSPSNYVVVRCEVGRVNTELWGRIWVLSRKREDYDRRLSTRRVRRLIRLSYFPNLGIIASTAHKVH